MKIKIKTVDDQQSFQIFQLLYPLHLQKKRNLSLLAQMNGSYTLLTEYNRQLLWCHKMLQNSLPEKKRLFKYLLPGTFGFKDFRKLPMIVKTSLKNHPHLVHFKMIESLSWPHWRWRCHVQRARCVVVCQGQLDCRKLPLSRLMYLDLRWAAAPS